MTLVTLFFFAHQPDRLLPYERRSRLLPAEMGSLHARYFDDTLNEEVFHKVADKCYRPATGLLRDLILGRAGDPKPFKIAFGLSGTLIEQMERFGSDVLGIFRSLARSGLAEFTGETYHHSLSGLFDPERAEFRAQARLHADRVEELLGVRPKVFRNTECLYNDSIAAAVQDLGYTGVLTEGSDAVLADVGSPDFVYSAPCGLPVLLRNYRLSDDVGYRFSNRDWDGWPLRADQFAAWMAANTDMHVLLALDYEAIGEHMWADTGIFEFLRALPDEIARYPQLEFATPTEAIQRLPVRGSIHVDDFATISWADQERDTSAWLGNEMQRHCYEEMRRMEAEVKRSGDPEIVDCWRRMLTSDHLYYMATKSLSDQDVHRYFSAYGSVFEAFVRLSTALTDLRYVAASRA
jgi:alpha-amylase